jgi:type IV pilus assembly protein PilV
MSAADSIKRQRGSTLFEVLISVLVLGIGILGVGAMQAHSLSSNHTASMRSQAVALSQDMADRMRANLISVRAAAPDNYATVTPAKRDCRGIYRNTVVAAPVSCTPKQLAEDDLFDWLDQVGNRMPAGAGAVCVDSTPDDGTALGFACDGVGTAYAIKVFWTERGSRTTASETKVFSTTVRP